MKIIKSNSENGKDKEIIRLRGLIAEKDKEIEDNKKSFHALLKLTVNKDEYDKIIHQYQQLEKKYNRLKYIIRKDREMFNKTMDEDVGNSKSS